MIFRKSNLPSALQLVNRHAASRRKSAEIWHLIAASISLVIVVRHLALGDVRLEALIEVVCAHACVDDCDDEQKDRDDGEGSERVASRKVCVEALGV